MPKAGISRAEAASLDAEAREALVNAAMQAGVDAGWEKREAFASDLGEDPAQVSLALRSAKNNRLKVQLWDSHYVATLLEQPTGLLAFIQHLGAPFGIQSWMADPEDPDYTRRELAKELTEKQRREWERKHGRPEGWLDR